MRYRITCTYVWESDDQQPVHDIGFHYRTLPSTIQHKAVNIVLDHDTHNRGGLLTIEPEYLAEVVSRICTKFPGESEEFLMSHIMCGVSADTAPETMRPMLKNELARRSGGVWR